MKKMKTKYNERTAMSKAEYTGAGKQLGNITQAERRGNITPADSSTQGQINARVSPVSLMHEY